MDERHLQRELMVELMTQGNCRAVVISSLDDRQDLLAVRSALQKTNELLSRPNFAVIAATPVDCAIVEFAARVEQALATLQLQQLDLLLLRAQSLPGSSGLHERKRVVLEAWEHMMAIQQEGMVQHIGVSDLSVQDVDFVLTKYPDNPPAAWSVEVQLPGMASESPELKFPLDDVTSFAHGHGIDVLARFPFTCLDTFAPQDLREDWDLLTQNIAERHRERPFKFLVTHENEASYHLDSHAPRQTTAMQTPLQIAVRYLLQEGLVVIPQGDDDLQHDKSNTLRELFGPLAHPFAAIHPSCSPHKMYSSLLARDELAAIHRALPLTASFSLPTPPRTPISTPGTSRPGSRYDRQRNLPSAFSRPSTAE